MKALSKLKAEEGIWMTDVPEPEVGHNDLLIKIRKTAICGTDVHIYNWDEWSQKTIPVPMVVGHEYVGEVVGIGQEVRGFKIGDRVSGEGHITCGHCRNCRAGRTHLCRNTIGVGVNRPGCFAEYLVIPAFNAFKIPDNISDDLASIFDPFGNAVHTALSFDLVGEDVLVSGAGPIGALLIATLDRVAGHLLHVVAGRLAELVHQPGDLLADRLLAQCAGADRVALAHQQQIDRIPQSELCLPCPVAAHPEVRPEGGPVAGEQIEARRAPGRQEDRRAVVRRRGGRRVPHRRRHQGRLPDGAGTAADFRHVEYRRL